MDPFALLATQLGVLLLAAIALGRLAVSLRLPPIVGELLAGVLLGPTVLGRIAPEVLASLFPPGDLVAAARGDFLKVGLLLFLLVVGLEINPDEVGARWRTILPTSLLGLAVPFAIGYLSVLWLPGLWGAAGDRPALAPTIGIALAISALPVIALIMGDLGLLRSDVGRLVIASAVVDDLFGWVGFAAVAGAFAGGAAAVRPAWMALVVVTCAFGGALLLGRVAGARVDAWLGGGSIPDGRQPRVAGGTTASASQGGEGRAGVALGLLVATALLASALMETVGAHAFLGALLVGLAASRLDPGPF